MKIGIITHWTSDDNYGQQLQCYALQKYLNSQGHDAFLIRYNPIRADGLIKKICRNLSFATVFSVLSGKWLKQRKENKRNEELWNLNSELNIKRGFKDFRDKHIKYSKLIYNSIQELRKYPPDADVYITGSDQVWIFPLKDKDTAGWYLDFGHPRIKRISYAASMGRPINKNEIKYFKHYLEKLDFISVRENEIMVLCHSLGFGEVEVTLDPTLLLPIEIYIELCPRRNRIYASKYILLYVLNVNDSEAVHGMEIEQYAQNLSLDIKVVVSSGYLPAKQILKAHDNVLATIPEWLLMIQYAEIVITTSFHGLVFCLKMHKPFVVVLLGGKYKGGNNRLLSLLKNVGLENRIWYCNKTISDIIGKTIDWDLVDEKLLIMRKSSEDFLARSLNF